MRQWISFMTKKEANHWLFHTGAGIFIGGTLMVLFNSMIRYEDTLLQVLLPGIAVLTYGMALIFEKMNGNQADRNWYPGWKIMILASLTVQWFVIVSSIL